MDSSTPLFRHQAASTKLSGPKDQCSPPGRLGTGPGVSSGSSRAAGPWAPTAQGGTDSGTAASGPGDWSRGPCIAGTGPRRLGPVFRLSCPQTRRAPAAPHARWSGASKESEPIARRPVPRACSGQPGCLHGSPWPPRVGSRSQARAPGCLPVVTRSDLYTV